VSFAYRATAVNNPIKQLNSMLTINGLLCIARFIACDGFHVIHEITVWVSFWYYYFLTLGRSSWRKENKKTLLSQGNRAMPQLSFLAWSSPTTFMNVLCTTQARSSVIRIGPTLMASAGALAYIGVWGLCPQRGPGAEPLVEGQGTKPPWSWRLFCIVKDKFSQKLATIFRLAVGEK